MKTELFDPELGRIVAVRNIRSRRVVFRYIDNYLQVTIPLYFDISTLEKSINELKPQLLSLILSKPKYIFTPSSKFYSLTFSVNVGFNSVKCFRTNFDNSVLEIYCPMDCEISSNLLQNQIRTIIERFLRLEARRVLSEKIVHLARNYGFVYTSIKINKSRTRWGSCSVNRTINLSYFCMLLPEYLIDFVLLHELCHTIEMNHGPRFWALLDSVTDNRAKELTKDLKMAKITW